MPGRGGQPGDVDPAPGTRRATETPPKERQIMGMRGGGFGRRRGEEMIGARIDYLSPAWGYFLSPRFAIHAGIDF